MRRKIALIALSSLTALTMSVPAQAHTAMAWECRSNSYQNDGDAGGRSSYAEYVDNSTTTRYAKGRFYALDERMTLRNASPYSATLRLFNARTGAQLGYLSAAANTSTNKFNDLSLAEGIPVTLELRVSRIAVCTATGAIT